MKERCMMEYERGEVFVCTITTSCMRGSGEGTRNMEKEP